MDADTAAYRKELREHFVGQMSKNSKLQNTAQQYKDFTAQNQQKLQEYEAAYQRRFHQQKSQQQNSQHQPMHHHHNHHHHRSSGGDADRLLYSSTASLRPSIADSYQLTSGGDNISNYHNHSISSHRGKGAPDALPILPTASPSQKYQHSEPAHGGYMYETDSNMGGDSGDSSKSHKSAKTVVTKRSSRDLRKMVKSQCKLHEVIDETLKQMCSTGELPSDDTIVVEDRRLKEMPRLPQVVPPLHCKRCVPNERSISRQKDVMTEIAKGDLFECRTGDTVTISVDDVVNSKVINPMIRKLQRMYLNNLREEMSLMEDLERLPHKVNEVYKATIFKQKD